MITVLAIFNKFFNTKITLINVFRVDIFKLLHGFLIYILITYRHFYLKLDLLENFEKAEVNEKNHFFFAAASNKNSKTAIQSMKKIF